MVVVDIGGNEPIIVTIGRCAAARFRAAGRRPRFEKVVVGVQRVDAVPGVDVRRPVPAARGGPGELVEIYR